MAPPNSRIFSVKVVLPASGCEMIAKVRRRATGLGSFMVPEGFGKGAPPLSRLQSEGKGRGFSAAVRLTIESRPEPQRGRILTPRMLEANHLPSGRSHLECARNRLAPWSFSEQAASRSR